MPDYMAKYFLYEISSAVLYCFYLSVGIKEIFFLHKSYLILIYLKATFLG